MFKAGRDENYDVCGLIDLLRAIKIVYSSSQHFLSFPDRRSPAVAAYLPDLRY